MRILISTVFILLIYICVQASQQYQSVKVANQNKMAADDSKIKSCLAGLYSSQIAFRKTKGYFAALPEELRLTRYKVCDGLEISTHFVTENSFRMTAKFNHKIWSIDQSKNLYQQR